MRNDIAKHIERVAKNVLGESKGKRHVFNLTVAVYGIGLSWGRCDREFLFWSSNLIENVDTQLFTHFLFTLFNFMLNCQDN